MRGGRVSRGTATSAVVACSLRRLPAAAATARRARVRIAEGAADRETQAEERGNADGNATVAGRAVDEAGERAMVEERGGGRARIALLGHSRGRSNRGGGRGGTDGRTLRETGSGRFGGPVANARVARRSTDAAGGPRDAVVPRIHQRAFAGGRGPWEGGRRGGNGGGKDRGGGGRQPNGRVEHRSLGWTGGCSRGFRLIAGKVVSLLRRARGCSPTRSARRRASASSAPSPRSARARAERPRGALHEARAISVVLAMFAERNAGRVRATRRPRPPNARWRAGFLAIGIAAAAADVADSRARGPCALDPATDHQSGAG